MSKFKSFAAIVLVTLTLASCNDKAKMLVNTWKIDDIKLSKPIPPQAQGFFQSMLQQMKDQLRLTYKADGSFEAAFGERVSKGKWTLSKDQKQLTSSDETGKSVTYNIIELSKDKFVYATAEKDDTATFYLSPSNGAPIKTNPAPAAQAPVTESAPMDSAAPAK